MLSTHIARKLVEHLFQLHINVYENEDHRIGNRNYLKTISGNRVGMVLYGFLMLLEGWECNIFPISDGMASRGYYLYCEYNEALDM